MAGYIVLYIVWYYVCLMAIYQNTLCGCTKQLQSNAMRVPDAFGANDSICEERSTCSVGRVIFIGWAITTNL